MIKRYKIQIFPTVQQEQIIWKHINGCRFIWNFMLEQFNLAYTEYGICINKYDMSKLLTIMRKYKNYKWLNNISRMSCIYEISFLQHRIDMFYAGSSFPKYKSKKDKNFTYIIRADNKRFYFEEKQVKIEKIGKVKIKPKNNILKTYNRKFYQPTIIYKNNKWFLSVGIDCENQMIGTTDKVLGIDLGIKELAVCSLDGEKLVFHNINKSKRIRNLESKIKHLQRIKDRKYRTNSNYNKSKSIIKYEDMLRKCYYRLTNIRQNYIHQTTHKLVMLKPKCIVMEDLKISQMIKNKHLSKKILDQKMYEFIHQMEYKSEFYGIKFIQVDRYFPSSKTCSNCGNIKSDLRLSDRMYKCDKCGLIIDRDFNAAINLMNYGINNI